MSVKSISILVGGVVAIAALYVLGARLQLYGDLETPGPPTDVRIPEVEIQARAREQQRAAARLSATPSKQILFGDLHVHTTFSTDAFLWSLPMMMGEGAHPLGDACDYARFCSAVDFWSINDHAEATTPRKWELTKQAIRLCNDVAGDPSDPRIKRERKGLFGEPLTANLCRAPYVSRTKMRSDDAEAGQNPYLNLLQAVSSWSILHPVVTLLISFVCLIGEKQIDQSNNNTADDYRFNDLSPVRRVVGGFCKREITLFDVMHMAVGKLVFVVLRRITNPDNGFIHGID